MPWEGMAHSLVCKNLKVTGKYVCLPGGQSSNEPLWFTHIMEYGSTPYIGMAPKKMAGPLFAYKVICSKLCPRISHKLLWTIPVILECFH